MSGSVNKVTLVGNLGRDPEVRAMQNGDKIVQLSVATSDRWKDKNTGEQRERAEWHRVVIFNEGLVNVVQQYVKKGANVYIEGQLTTRKWKDESTGQDKYSTEVVLQGYNSSLTMLDSRNNFIEMLKLSSYVSMMVTYKDTIFIYVISIDKLFIYLKIKIF